MKAPQESFNLVMLNIMKDIGQSDNELLAVLQKVADGEFQAQLDAAFLIDKAEFGPFLQL